MAVLRPFFCNKARTIVEKYMSFQIWFQNTSDLQIKRKQRVQNVIIILHSALYVLY